MWGVYLVNTPIIVTDLFRHYIANLFSTQEQRYYILLMFLIVDLPLFVVAVSMGHGVASVLGQHSLHHGLMWLSLFAFLSIGQGIFLKPSSINLQPYLLLPITRSKLFIYALIPVMCDRSGVFVFLLLGSLTWFDPSISPFMKILLFAGLIHFITLSSIYTYFVQHLKGLNKTYLIFPVLIVILIGWMWILPLTIHPLLLIVTLSFPLPIVIKTLSTSMFYVSTDR